MKTSAKLEFGLRAQNRVALALDSAAAGDAFVPCAAHFRYLPSAPRLCSPSAFTLIEIMIVVAIMGLIMAMGIPSLARSMRKEGMRKAVSDMVEACSGARAAAILTGQTADLVIRPQDKTISGGTFSASLPENVGIEILGVNFVEWQDADEARVRFYGNGTSDEFTIVLISDEHKATKISLEVVTGLADVEVIR